MFGLLAQAAIKAMVEGIASAKERVESVGCEGMVVCSRCQTKAFEGAKYCRACGKGFPGSREHAPKGAGDGGGSV